MATQEIESPLEGRKERIARRGKRKAKRQARKAARKGDSSNAEAKASVKTAAQNKKYFEATMGKAIKAKAVKEVKKKVVTGKADPPTKKKSVTTVAGDGPALVGAALTTAAVVKAGSKKSRSKRKGKKSKRLARKATRLTKRADKATAKGKVGKAAKLAAKAGVKTAKKKLVDTKKARIDKKIASKGDKKKLRKDKRKAAGHKISEAAKGARDKVVKKGREKVHDVAKKVVDKTKPAGPAVAMYGKITYGQPNMADSSKLQGAGSEGAPGLGRMSMGRGSSKYDNAHNIGGPSMSADHKMAIDRDKISHLKGNIHSIDQKKKGLSMHGKGGSSLSKHFKRNRK